MNIEFTPSALNRIETLLQNEEKKSLKLRIYIIGGGCSGFQYGFKLDDQLNEDDFVIKKEKIAVVIDHMSAQYLINSSVDYIENLQGARFLVKNPQAKTTCGCGSSFSLE